MLSKRTYSALYDGVEQPVKRIEPPPPPPLRRKGCAPQWRCQYHPYHAVGHADCDEWDPWFPSTDPDERRRYEEGLHRAREDATTKSHYDPYRDVGVPDWSRVPDWPRPQTVSKKTLPLTKSQVQEAVAEARHRARANDLAGYWGVPADNRPVHIFPVPAAVANTPHTTDQDAARAQRLGIPVASPVHADADADRVPSPSTLRGDSLEPEVDGEEVDPDTSGEKQTTDEEARPQQPQSGSQTATECADVETSLRVLANFTTLIEAKEEALLKRSAKVLEEREARMMDKLAGMVEASYGRVCERLAELEK